MNKRIGKSLIALAVAVNFLIAPALPVLAVVDPNQGPTGGVVTEGLGNITGGINLPNGNTQTNIDILGGNKATTVIDWNTFNVGSNHNVNWNFTGWSQTAVNKVNNAGGMSEIYGKLTNSCSSGACDMAGTGKVILLNPNGVTFFNGSSVNLNSFTVSSYNGAWDLSNWDKSKFNETDTWKLNLTNGGSAKDIIVEGGATIYGDKQLIFAAPNVTAYAGSQISTNTAANYQGKGFGNVRIFTGDGMNFSYNELGHVSSGRAQITNSNNAGTIALYGNVDSAKIDLRAGNANDVTAYNPNSNIIIGNGVNRASLKATKLKTGEDGGIYLEAAGNITIQNADVTTANKTPDDADRLMGVSIIEAVAKGDVLVKDSTLTTALTNNGNYIQGGIMYNDPGKGNAHINLQSLAKNVTVDNSTLTTGNDIWIYSAGNSTIRNGSVLNANNILVNAETTRNNGTNTITGSTLTANKDIRVLSNTANNSISGSTFKANNIAIESKGTGNTIANSGIYSPVTTITSSGGANTITNTNIKNRDTVANATTVTIKNTNGSNTIQTGSNVFANTLTVEATGDNTVAGSNLKGTNIKVASSNGKNTISASTANATGNLEVTAKNNNEILANSTLTGNNVIVTTSTKDNVVSDSAITSNSNFTLDASAAGSNIITNSVITAPFVNLLAKINNTKTNSMVNGTNGVNVTAGSNNINHSNSSGFNTTGKVTITATTGDNTIDGITVQGATGVDVIAQGSNTINNAALNSTTGNVNLTATTGNNTITSGTLNSTSGNVNITANSGTNSIDGLAGAKTTINGSKVAINSRNNTINYTNVKTADFLANATAGNNALSNTTINNGGTATKAYITASNDVTFDTVAINALDTTVTAGRHITGNKTSGRELDVNGSKLTMLANTGDINVGLKNAGTVGKGVIAKGRDVTIQTDGNLAIERLWSTQDMWLTFLNGGKVVKGNDDLTVTHADGIKRPTIRVDGWVFNHDAASNGGSSIYNYINKDPNEITFKDSNPVLYPGQEDFANQHYLNYGSDLVYLQHRLPADCGPGPTPPDPGSGPGALPDTDVIRLPLKYEPVSNLAPLTDNRIGMDVVAAAAMLEIEPEAKANAKDDDEYYSLKD